MLEESISCSPGNSEKKSRRSRRFHKNVKKKCEQNLTTLKTKHLQNEHSYIEGLYEESTSKRENIEKHLEFFNPFENEKLLAAADRAEASTSSCKLKSLTSKGFIRLESLPFKDKNEMYPMEPPERPSRCYSTVTPRSPQVIGPETQFGITESEFVQFCNDAESEVQSGLTSDEQNPTISTDIPIDLNKSIMEHSIDRTKQIIQSRSVVEEILTDFCGSPTESELNDQTPPNSPPKNIKATKSIVDEILEDFCGSPYRENSPKENSEESTPIFRFKSQPIRTYSGIRKKKLFTNKSNTDLNAFTFKDDGNTSDSSSGLSVQEDLTQSIVPQLDTVDLNNSVKLCENLLNLSSYFSQLPSSSSKETNSQPTAVVKTQELRLSAIVDDIIKIKSKPMRINWNKIEKEFKGFSDYESDSKESTLQELLEDEDDVLQQINCDSLCYEKVEPKVIFTHIDSDIENTLQNASEVIEKAKALILYESDVKQKTPNMIKVPQTDCDIQNQPSPFNSPLENEELFDEIDIWNDNEYLLNYKTQKDYANHVEHEDKEFFKDDFNLNKVILTYKESETNNLNPQISNSDTKIELCKPLRNSRTNFKDQKQFQNLRDPCSSASCKLSEDSRKIEKLKKNEGYFDSYKNAESEHSTVTDASLDNEYLNRVPAFNPIGFSTVSNKPILVSDIARQKANEFLKNFEKQELEERKALTKNDILSKNQTVNNVSNPIREEIIRDNKLKDKEVKTRDQYDISSENTRPRIDNTSNNVGFTTASKKHISISTKAKQKAEQMIQKFEQDEKEKRMLDATFLVTDKFVGNDNKIENNLTVGGFIGFSTASEKPIAISLEAKRKADEILKKFEQAEKPEEEIEKLTQRHPSEVSEEVRRKAQDLLLDIEFFEEAFEDELKKIEGLPISQVQNEKLQGENTIFTQATKGTVVGGFKTASRKSIQVSEEACRRAEAFFRTVCDEDLPQDYLKCIETNINDTNINSKDTVGNIMGTVEQVDGAIRSPRHNPYDPLETESKETYAANCIDTFQVSESKIIDRSKSDSAIERLQESTKEANLIAQEFDSIENKRFRKRKHSQGDELEKSSLLVTPRRLSCGERLPLNRIENGLLCKSSSLPLRKEGTPNSALISRKNLLSLSKRRKFDSPGQTRELKSGQKTPDKNLNSPITHCNASSTPNLKGFFETVPTSTPRLIRNDPTNTNNQYTSKDIVDSDFQRIQWEDSNNSLRINRTSCVDDVNVTFSAISPSPKQRIEQLKMYGEPPPISPISMLNKCRPSGLRRGRSSMKP
ncbi:uncharacterized protein LOC129952182 [Eupeodes corollae]|uniref:uncharacterized protein LOC129952182 n=1 Tax=Eupeodes corollae TaxID=290404 RepID=UPI002491A5D3|nr:uncharacterized protein LOC129952182 [Eupeodes corollae]